MIISHAHQKQLHHDNSILEFTCQQERTQQKNKNKVIHEFIQFLRSALTQEEERIPTQIPQKEKEKRLTYKKKHSEKKENRKQKIEL
jgi:ribosome-associated protein